MNIAKNDDKLRWNWSSRRHDSIAIPYTNDNNSPKPPSLDGEKNQNYPIIDRIYSTNKDEIN